MKIRVRKEEKRNSSKRGKVLIGMLEMKETPPVLVIDIKKPLLATKKSAKLSGLWEVLYHRLRRATGQAARNGSAEFPLSRHMDISRPSRAIVHGQTWLIKPRAYIKPQPFTSRLKARQDSSAIPLQKNCNIIFQKIKETKDKKHQRQEKINLHTKNPTDKSEVLEDSTLQGTSRVDAGKHSIANFNIL